MQKLVAASVEFHELDSMLIPILDKSLTSNILYGMLYHGLYFIYPYHYTVDLNFTTQRLIVPNA